MNPLGGNFANCAVCYTITFKVSAFHFFSQKLEIETVWFESPKLNPNNHYSLRTVDFVTL